MKRDGRWIDFHTRVPAEVARLIEEKAEAQGRLRYVLLRELISNYAYGNRLEVLESHTLEVLAEVAKTVGYESVDVLVEDLAQSFLRVWRFREGLLQEDEATPDEEIRSMFSEMIYEIERGRGVQKRP